ncbi:uncharacterized protein STEHIDRAFT_119662 [Stereum hirsutum FP-91666 SS1]|uniref:uncharacterized protein n=1 Tax=Stereum hirsutum (strain FP-91666) TaxID=721885 RepID=UPI000440C1CE|nr:uncharacterized protein STEHIDRAFT_119662 [Stereum hirsutum FP-91666 SS1]EIM88871.1 hypothetical protein STEHIDRAFT_119662 [Stereum hirsutum FP-91666 SS1]
MERSDVRIALRRRGQVRVRTGGGREGGIDCEEGVGGEGGRGGEGRVTCGVDDGAGRGVVAVDIRVGVEDVGVGAVRGAAFVGAEEVSVLCWLFQSTSSLPTTQLQSEQQKKKQTRHRHTCEITLGRLVIARPKSRQSPVFEFHDRGSVRVAPPTPSLTVRAAHPRSSSQCRPAGICTSALPTYPFQAAPLPLSANGHLHATPDSNDHAPEVPNVQLSRSGSSSSIRSTL